MFSEISERSIIAIYTCLRGCACVHMCSSSAWGSGGDHSQPGLLRHPGARGWTAAWGVPASAARHTPRKTPRRHQLHVWHVRLRWVTMTTVVLCVIRRYGKTPTSNSLVTPEGSEDTLVFAHRRQLSHLLLWMDYSKMLYRHLFCTFAPQRACNWILMHFKTALINYPESRRPLGLHLKGTLLCIIH